MSYLPITIHLQSIPFHLFRFPEVIGVGYGLNTSYLPCFKLLVETDLCADEKKCNRLKKSVAEGIITYKKDIDTERCKEFIEVGEMIDLPSHKELTHGGKTFSFKGSDDVKRGTITCLLNAKVKITIPGEAPIEHNRHYAMTCAHCILPTKHNTKPLNDFCIKAKLENEPTCPQFDQAWTQCNEENDMNLLSHYDKSEGFNPECLFRANYPWIQRKASDLVEDYEYQHPPLDSNSEARPVKPKLLMKYLCSRFGVYPENSEVPRMCLNYGTESSFRDDYSTCYTLDVGVLELDNQDNLQACCCQQSIPGNVEVPLDPERSIPKDQTTQKEQKVFAQRSKEVIIDELMTTIKHSTQIEQKVFAQQSKEKDELMTTKHLKNQIKEHVLDKLEQDKDTEKSDESFEKSELKRHELEKTSSSETEDEKDSSKLPQMVQYSLSDRQVVQPYTSNEYEEIPIMSSMRKIWSSSRESNITLKLALVTDGDKVRTRKLDNNNFYFELIVRHQPEDKIVKLPVIIFNGSNIEESSGVKKKLFIEEGVSGSPLFLIRDDEPSTFYFLGNVCGRHAASRCDVAIRSVAAQIYRNLMESLKEIRPEILETITSLKKWFQEHYLEPENIPIENITINPCCLTVDSKRQKGHEVMLASHNEQHEIIQVRLNICPCFKNCGSCLLNYFQMNNLPTVNTAK